eukprot:TRINITY_DN3723_c0_g1_i2.p1 TRINITY_DN3723_c0_g1~~TRINITY_DN3723_c0_g1_i2.p1  ORF type:complete len:266 (-),score=33.88 TRINITY_DN3723_c0_g1_i2:25-822(-)
MGEDAVDLAMTTAPFAQIVKNVPNLGTEIPQSRLLSSLQRVSQFNRTSTEDVRIAVSLLETHNVLVFLESILQLSRAQSYIPIVINEFIARKSPDESTADRIAKLVMPSSGELLLHEMLQKAVGSQLLNHLLAWFHAEGFDIMKPSPNTGLTIFDLTKKNVTLSDNCVRLRVALLVQRDPTLLDRCPEIYKAISTHDIVYESANHAQHRKKSSQAEAGSFPLKSFLTELPYDILREIVHHCSIRDLSALAVSCSALGRFASTDRA